jgi:hypothetical protein
MRGGVRIGAIGAMSFATTRSLLNLGLRDGWRKFAGYDGIAEADLFVRAVAEGLVGGCPATAQADRSASCEAEWRARWIDDLKIAFHSDGSIVVHRNLRRCHSFSWNSARTLRFDAESSLTQSQTHVVGLNNDHLELSAISNPRVLTVDFQPSTVDLFNISEL